MTKSCPNTVILKLIMLVNELCYYYFWEQMIVINLEDLSYILQENVTTGKYKCVKVAIVPIVRVRKTTLKPENVKTR